MIIDELQKLVRNSLAVKIVGLNPHHSIVFRHGLWVKSGGTTNLVTRDRRWVKRSFAGRCS